MKRHLEIHEGSPWLFPSFTDDKKPLSNSEANSWIRTVIALIPEEKSRVKRYSTHSGRRGAVTSAVRTGYSIEQIMQMVRWKSLQSALTYLDVILNPYRRRLSTSRKYTF
eukprot:TRINITY_DN7076_c0_g1_i1.p1 TRINITY_DN7076_c0_g1~~TRINITY_DN7076_c0_g1_i1.p1  ORF type:complete len:110 (-),score=1.30 TRINITY_DN7076_c0_g1_i1:98-427(-)